MIGPSGAVRAMMAPRPVDFRKGMDRLAALVRDALGADPISGTVYVFRSKRADRAKLLFWDGSGVVLATKRLEDSQFCWPKIEDGVVRLAAAQLATSLERLELATAFPSVRPGLSRSYSGRRFENRPQSV